MIDALMAKCSPNRHLPQILKATDKLTLVKCSKFDETWGNGMDLGDTKLDDVTVWSGKNGLGKSLETIGEQLE